MSDRGFVAEVYDASYRRLVVQLLAFCGDQVEAEDAVQEAFVKAISAPDQFGRLDNPEAWLRTVALNHLRSRLRRAGVLKRLIPRVPGSQRMLELNPDHVVLVDALRQLDPPLREVVVLHHIADLTVSDVASELGIPEGTVKTRLVKARSILTALLDDTEEPHHV